MKELLQYRHSITAQDGEDGIVAEIIRRLGIQSGWCVEFGAWDGKLLSNTWHLWHEENWHAVLIEGDDAKARQLDQSVTAFPKVTALHRMVSHKGPDSLDEILKETAIPKDFDILSIDVDGNDYYIWKALQVFHPKLVIIEYNATIPPDYSLVDLAGGGLSLGSSALALLDLAHEKNYRLIFCTAGNLFFLRQDLISEQLPEVALQDVFPMNKITTIVSTFTGVPLLTRQRPTHIRIDQEAGVGNQIGAELPALPEGFRQVIVLDKHADHAYAVILDLVARHKWLRNFLLGLAIIVSVGCAKR